MTIQDISQGGLIFVGALATRLSFMFFKKKVVSEDVRDPKSHKFFGECEFYLTNKIPNIKLYSREMKYEEGRTRIFKDMLMTKVEIRKKYVYNFALDNEENILESSTKCINGLVAEYSEKRKYIGIPQLVIDKFNEWHLGHATALMDSIEGVCGSRSFHNLEEKKNAILHLHTMMLVLTVIDAEKTLGLLNGQLTGIVYNGIVV